MTTFRTSWLWVAIVIAIVAFSLQQANLRSSSFGWPARVQQPVPAAGAAVTARVVAAANAFLATLGDAERARGTFAFTSSQRTGWSNLPTGVFRRNGLRFGDLTTRQRDAALALVGAALSR